VSIFRTSDGLLGLKSSVVELKKLKRERGGREKEERKKESTISASWGGKPPIATHPGISNLKRGRDTEKSHLKGHRLAQKGRDNTWKGYMRTAD
jgi:hypothetical protein